MGAKHHGFTLIELSIVIVIIGLIVAGIVAGQSLVKQAQLRSVVSDSEKFKVAFNSFRMQYSAIPGDMSTAGSYWTGVTNGNGNKQIEWIDETYLAWQHLGMAGLIPGSYTGTYSGFGIAVAGVNVPKGPVSGSAYNTRYWNAHGFNKTVVIVGKTRPDTWSDLSAFTAAEAFSVDTKLDDGIAGNGKIRALTGDEHFVSAPNSCDNPFATFNSVYDLSQSGLRCRMTFDMDVD